MKSYLYLITMLFIAIFSMACSSDPEVEVPKEVPSLSVSPTQVANVSAAGGSTDITIRTNQASWTATSDKDWCNLTTDGIVTFTIVVKANSTADERTATVTVTAGKATPVKITVSQKGEGAVLSVSSTQVTNVAAAGGNSKITVSTNQSSWSATSDNTWCKVTAKTGEDFTIVVDANSTTSARSATVTVTAGSATPVKISVSQLASSSPTLSVNPTQVTNVAAAGGNTKITVTTNQSSWSATSDNPWCKVTAKTGGDFTIAVDANNATSARSAIVTVSAGSATPVKISVTQLGTAPMLSISPTTSNIVFTASAKNEQFTYTVTTNLPSWDVKVTTAGATWCKVTKDVANNRFTITAEANDSKSPRGPAIVTISAGSAIPLQITVNQRANTSQDSEDFEYGEGEKWD